MSLDSWLERRLIVVSGKGGVGRSTLVAALGLAAARRGKQACIVELSGAREVAEILGLDGRSYDARPAAAGLTVRSLTAPEALDDFGQRKLGLGRLLKKVLNNRVSRAFLDAVPGLHDLLQLGKIENALTEPLPGDPPVDVMILDAPATGHGLTLLSGATSMAAMTRVGPFHDLANIIAKFLADPTSTALLLVTLPEVLPVHESLETIETLGRDGADLAGVVVNRVSLSDLPDLPAWSDVSSTLQRAGAPWPEVAELVQRKMDRIAQETETIATLRGHVPDGVAVVVTPRVEHPDPGARARALCDALETR